MTMGPYFYKLESHPLDPEEQWTYPNGNLGYAAMLAGHDLEGFENWVADMIRWNTPRRRLVFKVFGKWPSYDDFLHSGHVSREDAEMARYRGDDGWEERRAAYVAKVRSDRRGADNA